MRRGHTSILLIRHGDDYRRSCSPLNTLLRHTPPRSQPGASHAGSLWPLLTVIPSRLLRCFRLVAPFLSLSLIHTHTHSRTHKHTDHHSLVNHNSTPHHGILHINRCCLVAIFTPLQPLRQTLSHFPHLALYQITTR